MCAFKVLLCSQNREESREESREERRSQQAKLEEVAKQSGVDLSHISVPSGADLSKGRAFMKRNVKCTATGKEILVAIRWYSCHLGESFLTRLRDSSAFQADLMQVEER